MNSNLFPRMNRHVCAMMLAGAMAQAAMLPAQAQSHTGHGAASSAPAEANSTSTEAFAAANDKMHKDMAIQFSGDTDIDFVKSMIPHHQGAIAMAKIQLRFGKDAANRKLAEEIIVAQEKEIANMQAWLKSKGQ